MAIICKNVEKRYKEVAIQDINLEIDTGISLLIGSNGAGKSTLLNILATVKKPTEGEVIYQGKKYFKRNEQGDNSNIIFSCATRIGGV